LRWVVTGVPAPSDRVSRRSVLKMVTGVAVAGGLAGAGWVASTRGRHTARATDDARRVRAPGTTTAPPHAASGGVLADMVVGIDPGHNGDNWSDPSYINSLVWNGVEQETCDTTGTETAAGYTEAQFAFNVAQYLAGNLRALGATVVLTRTTNGGIGPCITQRAGIINMAHADVAVSIHADGGPVDGRGFSILEPVADGVNDAVISSSQTLGDHVRSAFLSETPMPVSDYYGVNGVVPRGDLGGLNLTTVPKVMVECGNMQNPTDAALLVTDEFQQQSATALAKAITTFLTGAAPQSASGTRSL
jgi:N-acetylmuramoyl-L-alanine amidase